MKVIHELDEHDIKTIITKYYKSLAIKIKEIKLIYYTNFKNCGMSEQDVPLIKVEIVEDSNI